MVIHPTTAAKAVKISTLDNVSNKTKNTIVKKYKVVKTKTDDVTRSLKIKFLILNGITRFGATANAIECFKKAQITCQRKILIDPVVEPGQPPIKDITAKAATEKLPHDKKSSDDRPVVVTTDTTLKAA